MGVGIAVSSTPVAVNNATADVGIFLMIGALRQAHVPLSSIRAGMFLHSLATGKRRANKSGEWLGKSTLGHDPEGKVLGILGMGGIGRVYHTILHCTTRKQN